jgi:hypothetical protein
MMKLHEFCIENGCFVLRINAELVLGPDDDGDVRVLLGGSEELLASATELVRLIPEAVEADRVKAIIAADDLWDAPEGS